MKFTINGKRTLALTAITLFGSAQAATFTEGFESVPALSESGWLLANAGAAPTNPWFQGVGGTGGTFDAQRGTASSYVAANYLSSATGLIDNWLISPLLTIDTRGVLSFYTRSLGTPGFNDRLEVYFSQGAGTSFSSFMSLGSVGTATAYPTDWTLFSFAFPNSSSGRFAFRQTGTVDTADYLGIDTVSVSGSFAAAIPEPSTYALMALGLGGLAFVARRRAA